MPYILCVTPSLLCELCDKMNVQYRRYIYKSYNLPFTTN